MEEKNYRMFMTDAGLIIGTEMEVFLDGRVKLEKPLVATPESSGSMKFAAVFMQKEDWVILPAVSIIEVQPAPVFTDSYDKAVTQIYSGIIMPSEEEKLILK